MSRTRADRIARRHTVEDAARHQGGLIDRRQVHALGFTRSEVRAECQARRWKSCGDQCLQVGAPDKTTPYWRTVLEVGPAAVLDGASALLLAGLRLVTSSEIHVAVPPGAWCRRPAGVRVHPTRRLRERDVLRNGLPRTRPAVAAVHAAIWARSDVEAAMFVVTAVQQGLVRPSDLGDAIGQVKRDRRRALLQGLLLDVSDGIESIDERAFAAGCRRRGFPKSDRQVVVRLPSGRVRYDNVWGDYLSVEIHGAQHLDVSMAMRDMLKQNAASMTGKVTLQIPNYAVRVNFEPFLDQMAEVFRAQGWNPPERKGNRAS